MTPMRDVFHKLQRTFGGRQRRLVGTLAVITVFLLSACAAPVVVEQVVEVEVPASGRLNVDYQGTLEVFISGYDLTEALTEAQKAAGVKGNEGLEALIAEWEAMNPGIDIVPVGGPVGPAGQDPFQWFVNTQVPAGQGPDIFFYYGHTLYNGAAGDKGLMVPLDAYLLQPNPYVAEGEPGSEQWIDIFENGFSGAIAQERSPAGHYYGIPVDAAPITIWYNKTVLDELGLEFPFPNYYSDLVALLEQLHAAGYEKPIVGQLGPATQWDNIIFDHSLLEPVGKVEWDVLDYKPSLVKGFIDKEEFARAVHLGLFDATGPEFREILRLGKMWAPYFTEEWKVNGRPGPEEFISGNAPVFLSGMWMAQNFLTNPEIDFEVGVATNPLIGPKESELADPNPYPGVAGVGMTFNVHWQTMERGTMNAAIDFLQFISAPQNWRKAHESKLGAISILKGLEPTLPEDLAEAVQGAIPTSQMAFDISGTSTDFTQQTERQTIYTEFYLGEITLDEAAERFQQSLLDWVERELEQNDMEQNPGGTWDLSQW